mgnify:CR=1 FL=1
MREGRRGRQPLQGLRLGKQARVSVEGRLQGALAAAEDPPGPLLAQLRIGGIMVVPVGQSDTVQGLIKVTRTETGYEYDELRPVRFVPLLEGIAPE